MFATGLTRGAVPALAALALALTLAAAGCGSSGSSARSSTSGASGSSSAQKSIRVGLVTDIGGLNDRSFNTLANKGLQDAVKRLGVQGRVLTSSTNADYVPNLSTLAQQGYDVVIGVGFLMSDALNTVATKFPQTDFAIVDFSAAALKSKPKNVAGLLFKENEAGYLVGYLAGLYGKKKGFDTISSVGGQKSPPVDGYIAGYQAGAKKADSSMKVLNDYSQSFTDQAKCKELGLNQIGQGSKVVFAVAGQCGLGALDAAKEKGDLGIGVDADQSFLGADILTSAMKRVDVAVFDAVKAEQDGTFQGGRDTIFDLKSDGVAIGKIVPAAAAFKPKIEALQKQIAAGKIKIPDTVQ